MSCVTRSPIGSGITQGIEVLTPSPFSSPVSPGWIPRPHARVATVAVRKRQGFGRNSETTWRASHRKRLGSVSNGHRSRGVVGRGDASLPPVPTATGGEKGQHMRRCFLPPPPRQSYPQVRTRLL